MSVSRSVIRRYSIDAVWIIAGVLSAGFGLRSFLLPNNVLDGGAVGISLLIAHISGAAFPIILFLTNLPFFVMGYKNIGGEFAVKTVLAILALSLAAAYIPYPEITQDHLLVATFGGIFLGAGIGFAMRGGGVIDGTEVLAIALSKKIGATIGDIVAGMNVLIFGFAAYIFSPETALYSILTYFSASKTIDFIVEGIEEYVGVTIISEFSEEIRLAIIGPLRHGVTLFKAERGYNRFENPGDNNLTVVFTVVTRLEVNRLKGEIHKIDPAAFVVTGKVNDTRGGMIKKRPFKEH